MEDHKMNQLAGARRPKAKVEDMRVQSASEK
jgi:hypothetical protein